MKGRILVIEDDAVQRHVYVTALAQAGYQVLEADNGTEGLRVNAQQPCDLILTDIFMPQEDGIDTIFQVKAASPRTRIVAMSGGGRWTQHGRDLGADDPLDIARRFGADRTLKKPFRIHDLVNIVDNLLGRAARHRQESEERVSPPEQADRRKRILVIDDDDAHRGMFTTALQQHGYEVIEAVNGDDGLRLFRQHPCDVIVTDIFMPQKEGLETIFELRAHCPHIKIIAVSGGGRWGQFGRTLDADEPLDIARRFGADRTLRKPVKIHQFLAVVDELVNK